jgi:ribosome maturation factor RimP
VLLEPVVIHRLRGAAEQSSHPAGTRAAAAVSATLHLPHFGSFEVGAWRPFFVMATIQQDKERQLQREISQTVTAAVPGVEVLALELTGKDRFRVYVDHPTGVDHALCERVTTVLRPYLEEYSVEVSSPGLDRPLRTRAHFERAVGRGVKVKTADRRLRGEVVSAGERALQLDPGNGDRFDIPYDAIVRANLIDEG